MIDRILSHSLPKYLNNFPAVALLGPRQVGKTTLAKTLISKLKKDTIYIDLEHPEDRLRFQNLNEFFMINKEKCIIIDEVQRMPELFPILRAYIDNHRKNGRFFLLGSTSPELLRHSSETLAGRICYLELSPLLWPEVSAHKQADNHWLRGGFPEAFLAPTLFKWKEWLKSFIKTYIERDMRNLGLEASPGVLLKLLTMIANNQGGILNMSQYAGSLGITVPTIKRYLDFFENSFLIRRLPTWHTNSNKRLVKAPKLYIRDTGILHSLLNIDSNNALYSHLVAGVSWETYVIEQIIGTFGDDYHYYYYRTQDGSECDLVMVKSGEPILMAEIKLSDAPVLTKGNYLSFADIKPLKAYIINPSNRHPFMFDDHFKLIGIDNFLKEKIG